MSGVPLTVPFKTGKPQELLFALYDGARPALPFASCVCRVTLQREFKVLAREAVLAQKILNLDPWIVCLHGLHDSSLSAETLWRTPFRYCARCGGWFERLQCSGCVATTPAEHARPPVSLRLPMPRRVVQAFVAIGHSFMLPYEQHVANYKKRLVHAVEQRVRDMLQKNIQRVTTLHADPELLGKLAEFTHALELRPQPSGTKPVVAHDYHDAYLVFNDEDDTLKEGTSDAGPSH